MFRAQQMQRDVPTLRLIVTGPSAKTGELLIAGGELDRFIERT